MVLQSRCPPRHIHVQTQEGKVYSLEVDRATKMRTLLKRLQIKLNVLPEQSQLVYKGEVVGDDLRTICEDMPVLLLPKKMERSISTPCLSFSESISAHLSETVDKDMQSEQMEDKTHCFSIVRSSTCATAVKHLLRAACLGVRKGIKPTPEKEGHGGSYFFKDIYGKNVAIVKPTDEEPLAPNNPKGFVGRNLGDPGLKKSVRVGEAAYREAAAFLLDHGGFARVPKTAIVTVTHPIFNLNLGTAKATNGRKTFENGKLPSSISSAIESAPTKLGSFQEFVSHVGSAEDQSTSRFSVRDVHRLGIFDIRLFNMDRHAGNILVRKKIKETHKTGVGLVRAASVSCNSQALRNNATLQPSFVKEDTFELIPIDHGYCLPETLDEVYFEWLFWPQASQPFSFEELEYVAELDVESDIKMLRDQIPMLREASLRMLEVSTSLLQKCVASGLSLMEIGTVVTRPLTVLDEEPSELEKLCRQAMEMTKAHQSAPYRLALCHEVDEEVREEAPVTKDIHTINGFCVTNGLVTPVKSPESENEPEIVRQNGFLVKMKNLYINDNRHGLNSSYRQLDGLFDNTMVYELEDEFGSSCSANSSPLSNSIRKLPFPSSRLKDCDESGSSGPPLAKDVLFPKFVFSKSEEIDQIFPNGNSMLKSGGLSQQFGSGHTYHSAPKMANVESVNSSCCQEKEYCESEESNNVKWSEFSDDEDEEVFMNECSSNGEHIKDPYSESPVDSISFSCSSKSSEFQPFPLRQSGYASSDEDLENEDQDVLHELPQNRSASISIAVLNQPPRACVGSYSSSSNGESSDKLSPLLAARSLTTRSRIPRSKERTARTSAHTSGSVHANLSKSRIDSHSHGQRAPGIGRNSFVHTEVINFGDMDQDFW
eukprot:CAMPEP_0196588458 /NCGR_PEP_ID=MMETSP1081-20130531/60576_1 /TAXON_ID=36882 /ORGANISM="Pyramimonas amylifera, Strain CCMP720" /LENGTH=881 /DNA_ID=CAMNT_0041910957 /DNA_START=271 /DNA_END=2913 /DNA_ORIENTATION=+